MNASLGYPIAIAAALLAPAALAQSNSAAPSTVNQPVHKTSPPPACLPAPALMSGAGTGGPFAESQSDAQWRAPKLIGVAVYSADDRRVGVVKDVLIDHSGAAQVVVIGVCGFLGIGAKDVGVPFNSVEWRTEGRSVPTDQPAGPSSAADSAGGQATPREIEPRAAEASQGYPDKARLEVTLAQLQSAPKFRYARSPIAKVATPSGEGTTRSPNP